LVDIFRKKPTVTIANFPVALFIHPALFSRILPHRFVQPPAPAFIPPQQQVIVQPG